MSALFHHDLVALRCLSCFFFQINIYELGFAISSWDGEKKKERDDDYTRRHSNEQRGEKNKYQNSARADYRSFLTPSLYNAI